MFWGRDPPPCNTELPSERLGSRLGAMETVTSDPRQRPCPGPATGGSPHLRLSPPAPAGFLWLKGTTVFLPIKLFLQPAAALRASDGRLCLGSTVKAPFLNKRKCQNFLFRARFLPRGRGLSALRGDGGGASVGSGMAGAGPGCAAWSCPPTARLRTGLCRSHTALGGWPAATGNGRGGHDSHGEFFFLLVHPARLRRPPGILARRAPSRLEVSAEAPGKALPTCS